MELFGDSFQSHVDVEITEELFTVKDLLELAVNHFNTDLMNEESGSQFFLNTLDLVDYTFRMAKKDG